MKKIVLCALLLLALMLPVVACTAEQTPEETTQATTEAPTTEAPTTEEPTTEEPTTEAPTTEAPTTEEPTTEEPTTEAPTTEETTEQAPAVQPTAFFTAEQLAALAAVNATGTKQDDYVHYLTGTTDTATNPSITLTAEGEGFSDIIAIKYRTNCGNYGSNYWGVLWLNGTGEFNGNRADSDNWFYYFTDGTWDVLIMDMRRNKLGAAGTPDTDVTDGAAITTIVYDFFDYTGNGGKIATADGAEEYFDIAYIGFFNTKEEAAQYCN